MQRTSLHARLALLALLGLAMVPVQPGPALAKEEAPVEIDYLALAARLLGDGHLDRASEALGQVKQGAPNLDKHRFHLIAGLIALRQQAFPNAAKEFENAIKTPPLPPVDEDGEPIKKPQAIDPQLYYYLAQAQFGAKNYKAVVAALDKAGSAIADNENAYQLRAQSQYELKNYDAALTALNQAQKKFPDLPQFERLEVFWLIDLGLYQEAADVGRRYLTRTTSEPSDHVAIGEALRRGRSFKLAAEVLEAAHLRYPMDDKILLALGHVYVDLDQKFAAGMVLEEAARIDPKYTVEAAELYRQAKGNDRALYLNARVEDQVAKFRQRLSILLDQQRFELVAGMAPTVERLGLLKDDQIRYAMAYGFFKTGDFRSAEKYLRGIAEASLFESANGLRRAMRACAPTDWECP